MKKRAPTLAKILVQFFGSALCGILLAILLGFIGLKSASGGGFNDIAWFIMGVMLGYPLGILAGIIALGIATKQRGSILGACIGLVLAFGWLFVLAEPLHLNQYTNWLAIAFLAIIPALATFGYQLPRLLTRR